MDGAGGAEPIYIFVIYIFVILIFIAFLFFFFFCLVGKNFLLLCNDRAQINESKERFLRKILSKFCYLIKNVSVINYAHDLLSTF